MLLAPEAPGFQGYWLDIDDARFHSVQMTPSVGRLTNLRLRNRSSIILTDLWLQGDLLLVGRFMYSNKVLSRPLKRSHGGQRGEAHDWPPGTWLLSLNDGGAFPTDLLVEVEPCKTLQLSWEETVGRIARLSGEVISVGHGPLDAGSMWFLLSTLAADLGVASGQPVDEFELALSRIDRPTQFRGLYAEAKWVGSHYSAKLGQPGQWSCFLSVHGGPVLEHQVELSEKPAPGELGSSGRWVQRDLEIEGLSVLQGTLLLPKGVRIEDLVLRIGNVVCDLSKATAEAESKAVFQLPPLAPRPAGSAIRVHPTFGSRLAGEAVRSCSPRVGEARAAAGVGSTKYVPGHAHGRVGRE